MSSRRHSLVEYHLRSQVVPHDSRVGKWLMRLHVAEEFDLRRTEKFATIPLVSERWWPRSWVLRARSTEGTVLQIFVEVLKRHGFEVQSKVGDVMDALGLTRRELHALACSCDHGPHIKGVTVADGLRKLVPELS
jgi:hypothetical protein